MIELPQMYTVKEAADLLRVTEGTVKRYLYAGQIKATKIGRSWRISDQELAAFMERGTEPCYMKKLPLTYQRSEKKPAEPTEE